MIRSTLVFAGIAMFFAWLYAAKLTALWARKEEDVERRARKIGAA